MKTKIRQQLNMNNLISFHNFNHPFKQVEKAIEELGELEFELEKFLDGDFEIEKLMDELFDVWILIEMLGDLFIGDDEKSKVLWFNIMDKKIDRELRRWGLGEFRRIKKTV